MNRELILEMLRNDFTEIQNKFGAESIALFGSFARDEQKPESDIDILVKMKKPDYSLLMALQRFLENKFNRKIDIIREGSHLTSRFYAIVGKDIIYV